MSPMGMQQAMKVHHFARGFWEHEPTSLTLGCKRLRPLAPKLASTATRINTFDLKNFIRPESGPIKLGSSDYQKKESPQVEAAQPGGTRWNPTQEQIGILEMLYRGGMRTPNAQQIEQITAQLGKYGRIEGKNVFYWFQNHKARERQKQKRNSTFSIRSSPTTTPSPFSAATTCLLLSPRGDNVEEEFDGIAYKRKCRSWPFDQRLKEDSRCCTEEEGEEEEEEEEETKNRTLKLFPLHPEGRY